MRRRLLLLMLALVTMGLGQPTITNGELNGLGWTQLDRDSKVFVVVGVNSGLEAFKVWGASADLPVCNDHISKVKYPSIKNGDMVKEVDKFYETTANIPLPVSAAVLMTYLKLNGATKETLDKFRAAELEIFVK